MNTITIPHFNDWSVPWNFLGGSSYLGTFTSSTAVAYSILATLTLYHMLHYFDYLVLPMSDLAWNSLVYLTPASVISTLDTGSRGFFRSSGGGATGSGSQWYATKSDSMRRILGLDGEGFINRIQRTRSISSIGTLFNATSSNMSSDTPPGLGNWDNSCYQNSVIQGLASLPSLSKFLDESFQSGDLRSTTAALSKVVAQLNDSSNAGKIVWTPPELKSMSSWQQQDAQEYYSKLLDEVEKEIRQTSWERASRGGLSHVAEASGSMHESKLGNPGYVKRNSLVGTPSFDQLPQELASILTRNPLEGLLAQRVGCLRCGFVEGLSLIPFNCLTVPLGKQRMYDVRTCLDDYTRLEYISGVDCTKCTLLQFKTHIQRLLETQLSESCDERSSQARLAVTAALQSSLIDRLSAVDEALNLDDFSDNTLLKKCQIPNKTRISPTKSRQAIIGRPPRSLVIHINRSVFDELSGLQRKNSAHVQFPPRLDLAPWCLGGQRLNEAEEAKIEGWSVDPSKSMLSTLADDSDLESEAMYELRAVITHYGRHENGHYICYRKHRLPTKSNVEQKGEDAESWWRLSDGEVSEVSEDAVLAQDGVFMLFYEKTEPLTSNLADHVEFSIEEKSDQTYLKSQVQEQALDERPVDENNLRDEDTTDQAAIKVTPPYPAILGEASIDESIPAPHSTQNTFIPKSDLPTSALTESTDTATQTTLKSPTPTLLSTTPTPNHSQPPPPLNPSTKTTPPSTPPSNNKTSPHKSDSSKSISSPPMRTAGPRGGRGSASRAGSGIGNVSSMVEAN